MLNKFFRYAFGVAGDKTAIPDATQVSGAVSYQQAYGPQYELPYTDPNARDVERAQNNQLHFDITTALQEYQTNATPDWIDPAQNGAVMYAYPLRARVRYSDGQVYESLAAANASLPTDATKWVPLGQGNTSVAGLSNVLVTLTAAQYANPVIVLTGVLTANINLVFPNTQQRWLVKNNCTGAFTITCKTAAGTGVALGLTGDAKTLWGTGVNIEDANPFLVKNYGTTTYQANAIAQFVNSDASRSVNLYQQSSVGAASLGVLERRSGATPVSQVVLKDGRVEVTDTSPTTSNVMQFAVVGSGAGLRFENITNSTGSNNIAFGWTNVSTLGLRIDNSNVGAFTPSDARLKRDVSALKYGLETVEALAVWSFVYDQTKSPIGFRPGLRFGWIAQEAKAKIPEVVHSWTIDNDNPDETTFLELDDAQMVPILWNAVRQLMERVKTLEANK